MAPLPLPAQTVTAVDSMTKTLRQTSLSILIGDCSFDDRELAGVGEVLTQSCAAKRHRLDEYSDPRWPGSQ